MATSLLQLSLAITPALLISFIIQRATFPWERQKRPSERAELLRLLASDIQVAKAIMAKNLEAVNKGKACPLSLPLRNWRQLKHDARMRKYQDEQIFKLITQQLKEWEKQKPYSYEAI